MFLLASSASCVPSMGSAVRVAAAPPPRQAIAAAARPAADPRMEEARRIFWQRAAALFEPASSEPAAPFVAETADGEDRARSLDCLTSAVYHEARSEPVDGQRAVAQVVLNRVRHPAFPASVCGVVFQGSQRRTGCQFSFTCDGSLAKRREPGAWGRARRIAEEALDGGVFAPIGNATHYHTTAILPYWAPSLRRSAVVGSHIFYRWRGSAGEASAFTQHYGGLEPVLARWEPREEGLPRIHRGGSDRPAERIALDEGAGVVTVHRGGQKPSDTAVHGVRVHVGQAPDTI